MIMYLRLAGADVIAATDIAAGPGDVEHWRHVPHPAGPGHQLRPRGCYVTHLGCGATAL